MRGFLKLEVNVNWLERVVTGGYRKTRPGTRPIPVADGWAGAEMRVFLLFDLSVTDRPIDRPTDGRTKPLIESLVCD